MPSISADGQVRLVERDFLMGSGTVWRIAPPGIGGVVGNPAYRQDVNPRGFGDGVSISRSTWGERVITVPVRCSSPDEGTTRGYLHDLAVAWRLARTGELALDVREAGTPEAVMRFFGRPTGAEGDASSQRFGQLNMLCSFTCTDPFGFGASVTESDAAGTVTLDAADMGDAGADHQRATITVVGNGGTPALVSATDSNGDITCADVLAVSDELVIDLRAMTATVEGVAADEIIAPSSTWFSLIGGQTNTLTLTGAASCSVTWRPAYL